MVTIRPTAVRSAGDHRSNGPSGVLDQSKLLIRSAISLRPTSHSLLSFGDRLSYAIPSPARLPGEGYDYGKMIGPTKNRQRRRKFSRRRIYPLARWGATRVVGPLAGVVNVRQQRLAVRQSW